MPTFFRVTLKPTGIAVRFMHAETNAHSDTRGDHTKRRLVTAGRNTLACRALRASINAVRLSDASASDKVTQIFLLIEEAVKAYCDAKGIPHEITPESAMSADRVSRVMEAIFAAEKASRHFSGEPLVLAKRYAFEAMLSHGEGAAIPYYKPATTIGHGTYLQFLHTLIASLAETASSTSEASRDHAELTGHPVVKGVKACYPKGDLTKAPQDRMVMHENPLLRSASPVSTESVSTAASAASPLTV